MKKTIILMMALVYLTGCSSVDNRSDSKLASSQEKEHVKHKKIEINFDVLEVYENAIPQEIKFSAKYHKHPEALNYVFLKTVSGNIRELPTIESDVIAKGNFNDKFKALEKVRYMENIWYKIELPNGEEGYISGQLVEYRAFDFHNAVKGVESALEFVRNSKQAGEKLAVVDSYKPDPNSSSQKRERDKYGTTEDQSLVGFNSRGEKIFIPDRSIVKVLGKEGTGVRVKASSIPKEEYITVSGKNLLSNRDLSPNSINKAVVVDITNQNKVMLENIDGEWKIISYVYSKTGLESELGYETPKGHFIAAVSKEKMFYNDALGKEQGYAKHATRFSGGGYVHSTPLDNSERENLAYFSALKEATLGTYPGTRKCIRTTEEHAKFIREWVLGESFNPNLSEQSIRDNVLFVVM